MFGKAAQLRPIKSLHARGSTYNYLSQEWSILSDFHIVPKGQKLCVNIYIYAISIFLYEFCFLWFTNCVLFSDDNSLIPGYLWLLAFIVKNTLILGIWCSTIPHLPGCFCPWTFFQNIWFNMVPSSYSTWIFCRGVLGFATECPCDF